MKDIEARQPLVLAAILQALRSGEVFNDDYCLYAEAEIDVITPEVVCYLDEYPEIVNDLEKYSDFVNDNKLDLLYHGEQFWDVVSLALRQKKNATVEELTAALNFYIENDNFMDMG